MGCWHGWHGCGPWYGPPYGPDPYDRAEWEAEPRRRRRSRRFEAEDTVEDLEAHLADLRGMVRRIEAELADLRSREGEATEGP